MITKSLNDGAGASPAAALSCLRNSTASSMSTSSVMTKSGAVALDSAIRRATVRCSRVSSTVSVSPRPCSLDTTAGGAFFSFAGSSRSVFDLAGFSASAPRPAASSASPLASALPFSGASVGRRRRRARPPRRRPSRCARPGPVPSSVASSTPISRAILRATGEAFTRPLPSPSSPPPSALAGAGSGLDSRCPLPESPPSRVLVASSAFVLVVAVAAPSARRLRPRRPSPASPRARPRSGSSSSLPRRLVPLVLASAPDSSPPSSDPPPPEPDPRRAIVSPTGSVSPSWATISSTPSESAS